MITQSPHIALVVDDDSFILLHACDILADAGFECVEAHNGDEAKGFLAKHGEAVTLLFTDVEMPGETNGFQLAHHAAERWADIDLPPSSGPG